MADKEAEKKLAARRAVEFVKNGMVVGLGSGTTTAYAIEFLGQRVQSEQLKIVGVPTSPASRALAVASGIPLTSDEGDFVLDLAIDGADQANRAGELIKGGGGAMLHERIVAASSARYVVIGDSSKLVEQLGSALLPIEVSQFGCRNVLSRVQPFTSKAVIRMTTEGKRFTTEEGNYIIDCLFPTAEYANPCQLSTFLRSMPGVVDHGLFLGMSDLLIIGRGELVEEIPTSRRPTLRLNRVNCNE